MKVTIVYDNEVKSRNLKAGWGFSSLIETAKAPSILFDTGADSPTLLHNMEELGIDAKGIGIIVISHAHGDHTGGLRGILEVNKEAEIYVPASFWGTIPGRKVTAVTQPIEISEEVFSTGELKGIEQSLAIKTDKGILVVVGCSHPGVGEIIDAASRFGKVYGVIGGFHGFRDFSRLSGLSLIGPCHCTQYKREILDLFPGKALQCGAGLVIELWRAIPLHEYLDHQDVCTQSWAFVVEFVGKKDRDIAEEIEVLRVPLEQLDNFLLNLPKDTELDLRVPGIFWILEREKLI